jgi:hypothetical protein
MELHHQATAALIVAVILRNLLSIVIGTRRDQPAVSGPVVEIEPLSQRQQLELARTLRGKDGEALVDQAWRTVGVRDLIAIPLYLTALLGTAPGAAFPQTKEEILRLFVTQHEQAQEKAEILRKELLGFHGEMLTGLAVEANRTGNTNITNSEAYRVIADVGAELVARKQLIVALQPARAIDVLVSGHLLVRSSSDDGSLFFQHQQFQEWYASRRVGELMAAAACGNDDCREKLRADIWNLFSWEESILFACERLSREGEAGYLTAAIIAQQYRLKSKRWPKFQIRHSRITSSSSPSPLTCSPNLTLARAFIEHTAALAYQLSVLDKAVGDFPKKTDLKTLQETLARHHKAVKKLYYNERAEIHVHDMIKILTRHYDTARAEYDALCEFVHPNYGSNKIVSSGRLGAGQIRSHAEEIARDLAMAHQLIERCAMLVEHDFSRTAANHLSKLNSWVEIACQDGAKLSQIFSLRTAISGDGKTKGTAFFFWKARTHREAVEAFYDFLRTEKLTVENRRQAGFEQDFLYEVVRTNSGHLWVKYNTRLPL